MTFDEAREELKQIAGGRYRALYYDLTENGDDPIVANCRVYIDPGISHDPTRTWREALDAIKETMYPTQKAGVDIAEAPKTDEVKP